MEDFWSLETIGILDNPMQADGEVAQQLFDNSVTKSDGRYEVRFPWKEYPPKDLPNNWCLAKGRLNTLCRRLNANPDVRIRYNEVIKEQNNKGIIEKGSIVEVSKVSHYIPHQVVLTPGKLRVVYDASAKAKSNAQSLNDCLWRSGHTRRSLWTPNAIQVT